MIARQAASVVSRIAIPALVLHALDDPLHSPDAGLQERSAGESLRSRWWRRSMEAIAPSSRRPMDGRAAAFQFVSQDCRHWAEATLVRYLMTVAGHADGG